MRKEVDRWRLSIAGESAQASLARLLIALEELRVRLNPETYPNLEVSDEGHLWFNLPSAMGTWEVFVLPAGLGNLPGPALAVSFPHRPEEWDEGLVESLHRAASTLAGSSVFAAHIPTQEILEAYGRNQLPPLRLLKGKEEILAVYSQVDFFCYCGLHIPVQGLDVLAAEAMIREIISRWRGDARRI
jgi:hypothetical protein